MNQHYNVSLLKEKSQHLWVLGPDWKFDGALKKYSLWWSLWILALNQKPIKHLGG